MDYLPTRDDLDAARLIPKHLAKVIRLLPNDAPDRSRASELFSNWKEKRRYDHELIPTIDEAIDPKVCLIGVTDYTFVPNSVGAMVWFWNNPLYPLFTLTLYWNVSPGNLIEFRAFFPYDSYEWDIFLRKKASVMILRKGQIFAALEVEMEKVDPQFWSLIDQAPPKQSVLDRDAARAWVEDQLDRKKSTEQQLECNWAKRLAGEVSVAMRFLNDPAHTERVQKEKEIMLSSPFAKSLEDKAGIAAHFYQAYVNTFFIRNAEQSQHPGPHIVTIRETLSEAPLYAGFIEHLLKCAFFSSVATSCGHEIRSLTLDEMVERVPLDTGVLGRCVEHFWERFSFDPPYYFKELYGAGACPVDIYKFVEEVPLYQGDLEKGEEFVKNLLAEATSLKQWTIPSGAYVQIECGNIKAVKIFELNNEVACVLVDHSGHYLTVWANPSNQQMAVGNQANLSHAAGLEAGKRHRAAKEEKACKDDEEFLPRILMGIKILLACIIRDFWVTEEREKIFGASYLTRKSPRLKPDWAKKVIVYLPRIRYVGDIANRAETLNLVARKPHFVVGHLRKALHASEGQIFLARNYGISVPEGFTLFDRIGGAIRRKSTYIGVAQR